MKTDKLLDKLIGVIPDALTGKRDVMEQEFVQGFGTRNSDSLIKETKKKTMSLYLIIVLVLVICTIAFVIGALREESLSKISRNEYGGDNKVITAEVNGEYSGEKYSGETDIVIRSKELTEDEKLTFLKQTKNRLPKLILGNNDSLNNVTDDLNLIEKDEKNNVEISWDIDDTDTINDEGKINLLNKNKESEIPIKANLRIEGVEDQITIIVKVGNRISKTNLRDLIGNSIDGTVKKLNENSSGDYMTLPKKTKDGIHIKWKKKSDNILPMMFPILIMLLFAVYYNRYAFIGKKVNEARESMLKDFPEFINKLLLLLNAGLVVTAAINKITQDYEDQHRETNKKYLYDELCIMKERITNTNSTLVRELEDIAKRSGSRDIMRFSSIIADNIDKGDTLAEKLKRESDMLWNNRKKRAEESGRLAETKLTFPMVLQLLVLIMITVAPAALEM